MAVVGNWLPTGNDAARLPATLRAAVAQLQAAANTLLALKGTMAQMLAGGSDYTTVETYFGLQAGAGQTVSGLVGTASDQLQTSQVQGLLQRLA
jgi:hypothetical protein